MSNTYSYRIDTIKKIVENGCANAVVQVYWTLTGTSESGKTGKVRGTTTLSTSSLNSVDEFIPFEELTDEIIISWVQNSVEEEHDNYMKSKIQQEIDAQ
jgi:hypothetical protein